MSERIMALVPAYNPDPAQLLASISSLLEQTVPIDICVVDDGSAVPVATLLPAQANLTVLRLSPNGGITAALRAGVDHALAGNYAYVCRLDVGDLAYPKRVGLQLQHMREHPHTDLLGGFSRVITPEGQLLFLHGTSGGPVGVRADLWNNAAFKHSTFFIRTAALRRLGNYDAGWLVAQDYELALRLSRNGVVDCLPETLIDYVDDPTGLSTRKRNAQLQMRLKAMLTYPALTQPRWYIGVLRTLVIMAMPHGLAKRISLATWRARRRKAAS